MLCCVFVSLPNFRWIKIYIKAGHVTHPGTPDPVPKCTMADICPRRNHSPTLILNLNRYPNRNHGWVCGEVSHPQSGVGFEQKIISSAKKMKTSFSNGVFWRTSPGLTKWGGQYTRVEYCEGCPLPGWDWRLWKGQIKFSFWNGVFWRLITYCKLAVY